jgi:hypothetical protein
MVHPISTTPRFIIFIGINSGIHAALFQRVVAETTLKTRDVGVLK